MCLLLDAHQADDIISHLKTGFLAVCLSFICLLQGLSEGGVAQAPGPPECRCGLQHDVLFALCFAALSAVR